MRPIQRWLLGISTLLTATTGGAYWWMQNMLAPLDPWAAINHPLQPLVLKLHILVAPVLVFAVGMVALEHIWKHLKHSVKRARRTGLGTLIALGPMVLSGYLLQAVTIPFWLELVVGLHLVSGLGYTLLFVGHGVLTRPSVAKPSSAGVGGENPIRVGRGSGARDDGGLESGTPTGQRAVQSRCARAVGHPASSFQTCARDHRDLST